jgi:phosphoserine phosphatase
MNSILTLIAAPDKANLDTGTVALARQTLSGIGASVSIDTVWLAETVACDIAFSGPDEAPDAVRDALVGRAIDVVTQNVAGRRKSALIADMDSTIITVETVDLLADRAGIGARVSEITERSMRGELDFTESLRARVAMLAGIEEKTLYELRDSALPLTPGARALVATMRANGAYTALVSGGFTIFTNSVADRAGFDTHQGNRLGVADGKLDGTLVDPVINRGGKRSALVKIAEERGITIADVMAIGDGANDLDMLATAGLGVAFRAKPVVAESAPARIDHGDLTAALYIQGYRRSEFVD